MPHRHVAQLVTMVKLVVFLPGKIVLLEEAVVQAGLMPG
jgi:hypothetical protein